VNSRQQISQNEWKDFLKRFSQRHNRWLITIKDGIVSMNHQPLKDIRIDKDRIVIHAGDHNAVIVKPVSISLISTQDGVDEALEILNESGKTLLIIDNPVLPEMVDGIP
jgi:hypothetical protein